MTTIEQRTGVSTPTRSPIGGYIGFVVGGPAATVPAAAISGLITGALVGVAQALAVRLPPQRLALWTAGSASVALGATTAIVGQISSSAEAVVVGAVSGLLIGVAQAVLLCRERVSYAAVWIVASGVAWGVGWFVTTGIGVSTATGWLVYGLSGALASQVITAVVLWKLVPDDVVSLEPA